MQEYWSLLWYDNADGLIWTEMEDSKYEHIFLTPSCIDYVIFFLEDNEKESANTAREETSDVEAAHYEIIFLTPSWIDYVILFILEDDLREVANEALGESADVVAFIGLYIEDGEVAAEG